MEINDDEFWWQIVIYMSIQWFSIIGILDMIFFCPTNEYARTRTHNANSDTLLWINDEYKFYKWFIGDLRNMKSID